MTADNWQKCCAVTLDYEGGNDDDPRDPGGRTSRGITQREWTRYRASHPGRPADVWKAPQADVVAIYHDDYWAPSCGDTWPRGLDLVVYDACVNSGFGRALQWARVALVQSTATMPQLAVMGQAVRDRVSVIKRYQARRLSFLHALRTWAYFGRGWGRRVAGIEAIATRMALDASGTPIPVRTEALEGQAKKARQASNTAAGGAAAAPPTAAASRIPGEHLDWASIALDVAVGVAVLALVVFLLHKWYVHRSRAQAFQEVAHAP